MSADATIVSIAIIAVLLVLSAFFSSSETAFMSLQRLRILHLAEKKRFGARKILTRMENPERTLSTVLLGNNLVNTAAASVGTALTVAWLDDRTGVVVATAAITLLILIFSEVIPKTFAIRHAEWIAFRYLRPFSVVEFILWPISVVLEYISRGFIKITGGKVGQRGLVSEDLLSSVISVGRTEGSVDYEEARMLQNVLVFGNRLVKEVMTPRTEMMWLDEDVNLASFLENYDSNPLSRFPVYKEAFDNVVGILHTRDVIRAMHKNQIKSDSRLLHLVRPAQFVPETKRLDDLFLEIKSTGNQMALIVDEYGGISGLVTTLQLVEAIMGPVAENEMLRDDVEEISAGTFQVDGGMPINEANETLGLDIPDGEYETVSGFILDMLAHIPSEGESFRYGKRWITVCEMKGVKIEKVQITKS